MYTVLGCCVILLLACNGVDGRDEKYEEFKGSHQICATVLTFNTALFESLSGEAGLVVSRTDRRDKIIESLQSTDADIVCLQEAWLGQDLQAIVDGTSDVYPFSFSSLHNPDGTVDGAAPPTDGPVCNASVALAFSALTGCLEANCDFTLPRTEFLLCGLVNCGDELQVNFDSPPACITCYAAVFPYVDNFFEWCAPTQLADQDKLKQINPSGLLMLSKKPLVDAKYVDLHPGVNLLNTKAYLAAKVGKVQAVCTHLSVVTGPYVEINLIPQFSSYAEQNAYEVQQLINTFGEEDKVILFGDLNVGPPGAGGIVAKEVDTYNALTDVFDTLLTGFCTFCPPPENPYNTETQNYIIDHVFVKGGDITDVQRRFTADQSSLYLPAYNRRVPLSDHTGILAHVQFECSPRW